jgi:hypothetical protein
VVEVPNSKTNGGIGGLKKTKFKYENERAGAKNRQSRLFINFKKGRFSLVKNSNKS